MQCVSEVCCNAGVLPYFDYPPMWTVFSLLSCVASCCQVLQCAAVLWICTHMNLFKHTGHDTGHGTEYRYVLQCVAECCSVLQCVAVWLQYVAACCSMVAVCCSLLQCDCSLLQLYNVLQYAERFFNVLQLCITQDTVVCIGVWACGCGCIDLWWCLDGCWAYLCLGIFMILNKFCKCVAVCCSVLLCVVVCWHFSGFEMGVGRVCVCMCVFVCVYVIEIWKGECIGVYKVGKCGCLKCGCCVRDPREYMCKRSWNCACV